ncbi:MAG: hypothetical protein LQ340_006893 [Diploschistes diacapsis]|nr:MAG: hypothetical protein LQ340_006893 [Diploschistes diacapsis]
MLGRDCKIKIDGGNDQAFFPGAPIHGIITYKASANDRLQSVNLDLRGVIRVSPTRKGSSAAANEGKPQTEHVELFHIMERILAEPIWTERRTLNWHFTIVLPQLTGPDRSHGLYADAGNPLFEEMPHPLPPSMGPDQSSEVEIAYNMYAVAKRSFRGYAETEQLQEAPVVDNISSLIYYPDPPAVVGDHISTVEKRWELVSAVPKPRKFSLKSSSTSSTLDSGAGGGPPTIVEVRIPTVVVLGELVNVALVRPSDPDGGETSSASVAFKSLSASLHALTHRRTTKIAYKPELTEICTKKLGTDTARGLVTLGSTVLCSRFSTVVIKAWPPTFKSYNVSRMYDLVIEVALMQGKHEFKTQFTEEVEVVRKLNHADSARRGCVAPPALLPLGPPGDEALPAYSR